jgi:23S rRNA pseudouridine1911/1915/1917 synthase
MPADSQRIIQSAIAGPEFNGRRLDQVAAMLFPDFSRGQLQKWLRSGELRVDGQALKVTYRIGGGETLNLDARARVQGEVLPQDISLDLIYQDDDLLVINKPAGLVVHPAAGNPDGTLQNALLYFDPALATLPRSGIVHRLDKETSGIMVVARSLRAHHSLVKQLQTRTMSRVYEAVAEGETPRRGTVDAAIGRHPRDRIRMAVVASGKPAVTHYRLLRRFTGFSHLEVSLESGRTHQIRVHLQHIGYPLLGDPVYRGSRRALKELSKPLSEAIMAFPRQALHARTLSLAHPADGGPLSFSAPRPGDLAGLLETLQSGVARI